MKHRKNYRPLRAEALEERLNMAHVVDLATDEDDGNYTAGDLSLREAIRLANQNVGEDTISFAAGITTIPLTIGTLTLTDSAKTTINGGGVIVEREYNANLFGIFAVYSIATAEFTVLTIRNGNAVDGGGIDNNGTLTVTNSTLSGNSANSSGGGGIANRGTLSLTNSTVSENSAGYGGGIVNFDTLVVTDSTVSGNVAGSSDGGGIANAGRLTLTNSTVSGNLAFHNGGGIANARTLTVTNSTVTNNRVDSADNGTGSGGGIWTLSDLQATSTIKNTIVAGNFVGTGTTASDLGNKNVEATSTFNLIGDPASAGGLTNTSYGNNVGFAVSNVINPTLANNGGPTLTHAVVVYGPAFNAGLNANASGLTTDQRGSGFPRIDDVFVDIGAVEAQPESPSFIVTTDQDVNNDYDGLTSLQEAVDLANSSPTADTISFAAWITTIPLTTGFRLTDSAKTTINGRGVIVDGGNANRIFYVDSGAVAELNGLTIRNGDSTNGYGGGIFNGGTLTVTNAILSGNSAAVGGGIYSRGGTLTITNSTFSGNAAYYGGGVYNSGGTLTITNSTFSGNLAESDGGGIHNEINIIGTLTVTSSTLSGNSAGSEGGGIFNDGTLTVTNSTVSGNSAVQDGGGISNRGTLTVTNSTLSENSAGYNGGGIRNDFGGTLTVTNSTLSGNSANASGGGIYNYQTLMVTNSTLTQNLADSDNSASGDGGGIWTATFAALHNTIVARNFRATTSTASELAGLYVASTSSYNLIGDTASAGGLTNNSNGNKVGVAVNSVLNPTLANNGGPTLTHALITDSPAINAGSNANSTGLTTDQRGAGFARILGGTVDIGAFERPSTAPGMFTLTSNLTTPVAQQPITITVTLGSPTPTGTISIVVDGTPGAPINLFAGQAIVTLNGLPVGLHTIFARYSGDANYAAVDSAVLNQQVYSPSDLNRTGAVDITDVLIEVFYFNTYANQMPIAVANLPAGPPFVDASGDGFFDIKDLLRVVFDYNVALGNPEGEFALPVLSSLRSPALSLPPATDAVLADDIDWLWPELLTTKRRRA